MHRNNNRNCGKKVKIKYNSKTQPEFDNRNAASINVSSKVSLQKYVVLVSINDALFETP